MIKTIAQRKEFEKEYFEGMLMPSKKQPQPAKNNRNCK